VGYLFLSIAIASEIIATLSLRASEGFSKPHYAVVVVAGYLAAFVGLSMALQRGLPLGVAYGTWAAAGVALVAVLSVPLFGESLTPVQIGGIGLVVAGGLGLELGGPH